MPAHARYPFRVSLAASWPDRLQFHGYQWVNCQQISIYCKFTRPGVPVPQVQAGQAPLRIARGSGKKVGPPSSRDPVQSRCMIDLRRANGER